MTGNDFGKNCFLKFLHLQQYIGKMQKGKHLYMKISPTSGSPCPRKQEFVASFVHLSDDGTSLHFTKPYKGKLILKDIENISINSLDLPMENPNFVLHSQNLSILVYFLNWRDFETWYQGLDLLCPHLQLNPKDMPCGRLTSFMSSFEDGMLPETTEPPRSNQLHLEENETMIRNLMQENKYLQKTKKKHEEIIAQLHATLKDLESSHRYGSVLMKQLLDSKECLINELLEHIVSLYM